MRLVGSRQASGRPAPSPTDAVQGRRTLALVGPRCQRGRMWIDGRGSAVLPRSECLRLLAVAAKAGDVGRLGFSPGESPEQPPVVVPLNFRVHDEEVFLRIGEGLLSRRAAGHLVAFEVDRVDRAAGEAWSVLVRGLARLLTSPEAAHLEVTSRPLVPEPGDMVMVLRPDVITGRQFALG